MVAAQAFHWFDLDRALPEIARVLKPGGRVGLIWNYRDETIPWVRRLGKVIGTQEQDTDPSEAIRGSELFDEVEETRYTHWQQVDRKSIQDLVLSRSNVAVLDDEARAAKLAEVVALYDEYGRGMDGMQLPYVARCFRATVLDRPGAEDDPEPSGDVVGSGRPTAPTPTPCSSTSGRAYPRSLTRPDYGGQGLQRVGWRPGVARCPDVRRPDGWPRPSSRCCSSGWRPHKRLRPGCRERQCPGPAFQYTQGARIAVDPAGNATAVWFQNGASVGLVRASHRAAGGTWSAPVTISDPARVAQAPDVVVDRSGTVTVAWIAYVPGGSQIESARLPRGGSWTAPGLVGPADLAPQAGGGRRRNRHRRLAGVPHELHRANEQPPARRHLDRREGPVGHHAGQHQPPGSRRPSDRRRRRRLADLRRHLADLRQPPATRRHLVTGTARVGARRERRSEPAGEHRPPGHLDGSRRQVPHRPPRSLLVERSRGRPLEHSVAPLDAGQRRRERRRDVRAHRPDRGGVERDDRRPVPRPRVDTTRQRRLERPLSLSDATGSASSVGMAAGRDGTAYAVWTWYDGGDGSTQQISHQPPGGQWSATADLAPGCRPRSTRPT